MYGLSKPCISLTIRRGILVFIVVIVSTSTGLYSDYVYCITISLDLISQVLAINVRCTLAISANIGLCSRLALTMMSAIFIMSTTLYLISNILTIYII